VCSDGYGRGRTTPLTNPGGPRPRTVAYAIWCLSISLLIGTGILGFGWEFPQQAFLTFLIIGFLVFQVARGRNWARWILTIITATSLVLMWSLIRFQLTYSLPTGVATVIQVCLEVIGCGLLFLPQSNRWYRRVI
jgi:hypothetical protein